MKQVKVITQAIAVTNEDEVNAAYGMTAVVQEQNGGTVVAISDGHVLDKETNQELCSFQWVGGQMRINTSCPQNVESTVLDFTHASIIAIRNRSYQSTEEAEA